MRNIILLICACAATLLWVGNFFPAEKEEKNKAQINEFNINASDTGESQFDVEQLAKILGVDYQLIEGKNKTKSPDYIDITLSLVAIYRTGDMAKVRLKVKKPTKEIFINAAQGDEFESLILKKISATTVEILNNEHTTLLKMYKPQVISIINTNSVEEATK